MLALLVEALLGLLLLSLAPSATRHREPAVAVFDFAQDPAPQPAPEPAPAPKPAAEKAPTTPDRPRPPSPVPPPVATPVPPTTAPAPAVAPRPVPVPVPAPVPPLIPLSREQMAAADIGTMPAGPPAPARRPAGPPDRGGGSGSDTPRVAGSGPHGEPLYAAAWYREPYDDELRGYLSTAQGPGWALIACRTVADYRVEDCVALDEYPDRSNIARSVLAAAWQFRVRPPRLGGQSMVGEWVRIRIDYDLKRK